MASAPKLLGYLPIDGPDSVDEYPRAAHQPQRPAHAPAEIPPMSAAPSSASEAASDPTPEASTWALLVHRVQRDEPGAMEELYRVFHRGIRYFLCRQIGPEALDDNVHDAFLIVVESIRLGELRDPARLMGYVRTVVRRMVAAHIDRQVQNRKERAELDFGTRIADSRSNPEQEAIFRQKVDLVRRVLSELPERDREILQRCYVEEESQETICEQMHLTLTQFRLLKYRAKARFGELGKKRLHGRLRDQFLLRISGG